MKEHHQLFDQLKTAKVGPLSRDEPLRKHCSWRIGWPADILVEPRNEAQLKKIFQVTTDSGVPVVINGCGTNLLFDDTGVRGVVVKIGERMSGISITGTTIRARGGAAGYHAWPGRPGGPV